MSTTWPAAVIERFVMEKMNSIKGAFDVFCTGDKLIPWEENSKTTFYILKEESNAMNMVLQGHQDAILAPKHRKVKKVVSNYYEVMDKQKNGEDWSKLTATFIKDLMDAMRGGSGGSRKSSMASKGSEEVQIRVPLLLPKVSEDCKQAEQADSPGAEADTRQADTSA